MKKLSSLRVKRAIKTQHISRNSEGNAWFDKVAWLLFSESLRPIFLVKSQQTQQTKFYAINVQIFSSNSKWANMLSIFRTKWSANKVYNFETPMNIPSIWENLNIASSQFWLVCGIWKISLQTHPTFPNLKVSLLSLLIISEKYEWPGQVQIPSQHSCKMQTQFSMKQKKKRKKKKRNPSDPAHDLLLY